MTDEELQSLFAKVSNFDWLESKREINLRKHKIDFMDVRSIFDSYTFIRRSDRHGEFRYHIFGYVHGQEVAVACTLRGTVCRLISARRAHRDERRKFYNRLEGQSEPGQD